MWPADYETGRKGLQPLAWKSIAMKTSTESRTTAVGLSSGTEQASEDLQISRRTAESGTQPSVGHLQFRCSDCELAFASKIGLGVHKRRAHPVTANAESAPSERVKKRWSDEELSMMASAEARLVVEKGTCSNVDLMICHKEFGRTLEAIKGKRRANAYKSLVLKYVEELRVNAQRDSTREEPTANQVEEQPRYSFEEPPAVVNVPYSSMSSDVPEVSELLANLLERAAARKVPKGRRARVRERKRLETELTGTESATGTMSARKRRRLEYARVQEMYKKNRRRCAAEVIDGATKNPVHSLKDMEAYWRPVLERVSEATGPTPEALKALKLEERNGGAHDYSGLWAPFTPQEIRRARIDLRSAPGPDGITPEDWGSVSLDNKARIFNEWLTKGEIPVPMRQCRTIFIPKKEVPAGPSDYRPISVASIPLRHMHTLLARRLLDCSPPDVRQRGFIYADGTLENTGVLDAVLGDSRQKLRECHMAVLDFSKAFDTVSHAALVKLLRLRGLPGPFCDYIARLYETATTTLATLDGTSLPVKVGRGVRQGDPLSPLLFNMAMDVVLASLPKEVGYRLELEKISALAYADDLVLLAGTKVGLQSLIDVVDSVGETMGLRLNHSKCAVLSMVPDGHNKKVHYLSDKTFKVGRKWIKQVSCVERWRYLGVDFEATGSKMLEHEITRALINIKKASLKPQQRLEILRAHLIPRFLHGFVLGRMTDDRLSMLDVEIRKAVRAWLRLPLDTPVAYFHAPVKQGGLGVPSMRSAVPDLIVRRYGRLGESEWGAAKAASRSRRIQNKLRWARKLWFKLTAECPRTGRRSVALYWSQKLHTSVDGLELRESSKVNGSSKWIRQLSNEFTGRDYVDFVRCHINALPSRIRNSRGRRRDETLLICRAGCMVKETTAHAIQCCHRTHGGRIERHNKVASIVADAMSEQGWTVESEPHIRTEAGLRKPDIIAAKDGVGVIVDAQVVSGQRPLDDAHREKRRKYADHAELIEKVRGRLGLHAGARVNVTTCTLSWRGVWSRRSYMEQKSLLGLKEKVFWRLPAVVMRGSCMNWTRFNQMTGVRAGWDPG